MYYDSLYSYDVWYVEYVARYVCGFMNYLRT
jgi:hypothetical protein